MCQIFSKMIGDINNGEIPFGFTADGLFEIILRPGKFFFQKKKFFLQILVFYEIVLIGLIVYRVCDFFFSVIL